MIRGVKNDYVNSYHHDQLSIFGKGMDEGEDLWKSVIRQALIYEYLEKDIDNVGVLKVSDKGADFLKKPSLCHAF